MTEVYLHGDLAMKFGPVHKFDVFSVAEACRAMEANHKGFYNAIRPGKFQIIRGDYENGEDTPEEMLTFGLSGRPVHIVPVVEGGKSSKGIISIVLGVVLIGAALFFAPIAAAGFSAAMSTGIGFAGLTFGNIAMFGAALALGGISQLMAPAPEVSDYKTRDKKVSFLFDGPVNRGEQGGALPLIYGGPIRVGSVVVSGGITVFDGKVKLPDDLASTITAMPKNGIKPCGAVQVLNGAGITFKIRKTRGDGKTLSHVDVDSVSVGKVYTYTFNNVTTDHTITAVYT